MKSERGGIVVYLIIGLVLFGALLGGVWWVKQRTVGAGDATQKTTTPGTSQTETQVSQDAQPERDATSEEAPSTTTPAPTPAPAAPTTDYPQQTSSTATTQPSTTATTPSPSSSGSTAAAGNKPVANTGPAEDAALTAVALSTLGYVAVAYVRSRSIVG